MFIKLYNQIMEDMNDDLYSIRKIANSLIRANKRNNDESINKSNNEKAVHYALDILTDTYNSDHFDYLLKKYDNDQSTQIMLNFLIKDIFHNKEKYEEHIKKCNNTVNYLKKVFEEFNKNYKQIDITEKIQTFKTISNSKISYDESNTAYVEFTNLFAPCLQFLYMYRPNSDQNIIGAGEYLFNALAKNTSLRLSGNKNYDLDINSLILKNNKNFSKIDIKKFNANKININKDVLTIYVGISGNKLRYNARMLN